MSEPISEPCGHCADRDRQRARLGQRLRSAELVVVTLIRENQRLEAQLAARSRGAELAQTAEHQVRQL